jgi:hypothetical protein
MEPDIIQQDDLAWSKMRHDNPLNKGFKHVAIDTPGDL